MEVNEVLTTVADLRHEQWIPTLRLGTAQGVEPEYFCSAFPVGIFCHS